jgi:hypothetical protein
MKFAPDIVKVALAVAILIGLAHAGAKAADSGNELLESCEIEMAAHQAQAAPSNMLDVGRGSYCLGFIAAILSVGPSLSPDHDRFCPPRGSTVGQGVAVFVKFLKANPDVTHYEAGPLAALAFALAWPCK